MRWKPHCYQPRTATEAPSRLCGLTQDEPTRDVGEKWLNLGGHFLYTSAMAKTSVRQFDIFAHLAAGGSVARCAMDLDLAREDVESGIASLERRLGYRLFEQRGDARRLTAAGRKTAQAMALLATDTQEVATAPPPTPQTPRRRPIMLAAPPAILGHFQDALAAFEEANDDIAITLDLTTYTARDAATALGQGRADIAYFYALGEPAEPASRYGWSETLNLYAGDAHRLTRADSVSRADIADEPMLALNPRNPLRTLAAEALGRAGLRLPPVPTLETDDMMAIVEDLRAGRGWFAAFGPMARDLGRAAGIRRISLDMPLPGIEVRQALAPTDTESPARALADYLFR